MYTVIQYTTRVTIFKNHDTNPNEKWYVDNPIARKIFYGLWRQAGFGSQNRCLYLPIYWIFQNHMFSQHGFDINRFWFKRMDEVSETQKGFWIEMKVERWMNWFTKQTIVWKMLRPQKTKS